MTRTRRIALILIFLSSGISILWGSMIAQTAIGWPDFKAMYYDARCLLQQVDPYKEGEPLRVLQAEKGEIPQFLQEDQLRSFREILTHDVYLPTASVVVLPFAMLPWGPAHWLWTLLTAVSLTLAAILMWNCGAKYAPIVSGGLICLILFNCESIYATGNAAGIAVGLCVVAVWCFLHKRFVPAGILCLAISLALKPHEAGLVWLYFLLVGGILRKRALQVLALTAALCLPGILWVTHVAPHWMNELHANLLVAEAPGGLSNPGLASANMDTPDHVIDLQTVISVFRDDPRTYNLISYAVCGAFLLVWSVATLRLNFSQRRAWLALAAIAALAMLPVYHRNHDARLLLLAVPACAMLWAEGRSTRWIALLMTTAGMIFTADIPAAILLILTSRLHLSTGGVSGHILTVLVMRPTPLILLAMGIFYLWVYVRRDPAQLSPVA
jgi:hypothetical protein